MCEYKEFVGAEEYHVKTIFLVWVKIRELVMGGLEHAWSMIVD